MRDKSRILTNYFSYNNVNIYEKHLNLDFDGLNGYTCPCNVNNVHKLFSLLKHC